MKVSTKFEVDTTIRCRVIALLLLIRYVTLWPWPFDLLTLVSGHTWRVTWSTPPPSLKILWLSVLELWVLTSPIGYHWQCVCSHCACAVSRDLCLGGIFPPHIWNPWPRFAYSLYNFYRATMTFTLSTSNAKAVFRLKMSKCRLNRAPKWRFLGKKGV